MSTESLICVDIQTMHVYLEVGYSTWLISAAGITSMKGLLF